MGRRRALGVVSAEQRGQELEFTLSTGERAVIRSAAGAQLQALQDFDTWTTTLPADVIEDLEHLDHD
ncbi:MULTISPECIES: hypothetical protein [unclassified Amycolatopsis]|uniref:hypothetical protein n=1 Tax=unclassified Amycolatopsis TaxID=2618356 RepID=UPI001C69DD22|nr:hypothetical protein [Amycolatopsis sp. DSM 110486]QYN19043.1 hypothetical protein K1T34_41240 [Amycolatopsis sp. DSM 110486]